MQKSAFFFFTDCRIYNTLNGTENDKTCLKNLMKDVIP